MSQPVRRKWASIPQGIRILNRDSNRCGWCDIAYDISEVVTGINELNSGQYVPSLLRILIFVLLCSRAVVAKHLFMRQVSPCTMDANSHLTDAPATASRLPQYHKAFSPSNQHITQPGPDNYWDLEQQQRRAHLRLRHQGGALPALLPLA